METHMLDRRLLALLLGFALCAGGGALSPAHAQVVTNIASDGTLPVPTLVTAPAVINLNGGNVYSINQGTVNGVNQFHSLQHLNIGKPAGALPGAAPDIASFGGPASIQNILVRVTSGGASQIDGVLQSTIDGANLFLMNPAGIIFGANARLDVSGAFHATTAHRIRFDDQAGTVFNAAPSAADASLSAAANPLLASAHPAAFGFLQAPAAIEVGSSELSILAVPDNTLSLVGGNINIGAPDGSAPGLLLASRINLVSVASAGEATFDGKGFNVDGFAQLGDVNIRGFSIVDAREVFIRGGRLVIEDAVVFPGAFFLLDITAAPPDGGEVNVKVAKDVLITGSELHPFLGDAPGIQTFAGSTSEIAPPRDVPDIRIEAGGTVSLSGVAVVQTIRNGPGTPPEVRIKADTVSVTNGASINVLNFFAPDETTGGDQPKGGGSLIIDARMVELSAEGSERFTGLAAQGQFHPGFFVFDIDPALTFADGGTITVNADTLAVRGGANINADGFAFGPGGDITVNARNILLSGNGQLAAQSVFAGKGGNIKLTASERIEISGGFRISATAGSSGNSGAVDVTAGQSIIMSGTDSSIISLTAPPPDDQLNRFAEIFLGPGANFAELLAALDLPANADIFAVLETLTDAGFVALGPDQFSPGHGGRISLSTPMLTMNSGARIDSSTAWDGNAGEVQLNIGSLGLNGGAQIRSRSGLFRLDPGGLDTGELVVGTGNAGLVAITATSPNSVTISGPGSTISTTSFGAGAGGAVNLTSAGQILISNGGSVTADSFGTGFTGDINITAGTSILMDNGTVSTRAVTSDGGNIKLTAPSIVRLDGSTITTSVESGKGGGGNINIDPQFVLVNNSSVIANAFGGPGGNITIVADNFLSSANSVIQASSALSTPGVINIFSPENNVENSISQLPAAFIDASALLRGLCTARRTGAASSFVVAGRGGVPGDADGYLPSFGTDVAAAIADAGDPDQVAAGRTSEPPLVVALLLANDLDCAR